MTAPVRETSNAKVDKWCSFFSLLKRLYYINKNKVWSSRGPDLLKQLWLHPPWWKAHTNIRSPEPLLSNFRQLWHRGDLCLLHSKRRRKKASLFSELSCKNKLALLQLQSPRALCNSSKDVSEQAMGQNKSLVIYRIIKILIAAMFLPQIGLYFQESKFPGCPRLFKSSNWPTERLRISLSDWVYLLLWTWGYHSKDHKSRLWEHATYQAQFSVQPWKADYFSTQFCLKF